MNTAVKARWDWSDWVSPLLIKELRQGLKDAFFLIALLGLLFILGFMEASELLFYDNAANQGAFALLLMLAWVLFLGLLPVRTFFSASIVSEVENNTFDSLLLTSVGVRGIILGKWCSFVFQSFLLATLLVPFFEVQYLVGGADFLSCIGQLAAMFCLNSGLTAIVIGLSCVRFPLIRYGGMVLLGIIMFTVAKSFLDQQFYNPTAIPGGMSYTPPSWSIQQMSEVAFAALLFAFALPLLIAELLVAYFSVTDSSPLFRRSILFVLFQVGTWTFCFLEPYSRSIYVVFLMIFTAFFLADLVQPTLWKPTGNWRKKFWLAQHPLGALIYGLALVPVITLTVNSQFLLFPINGALPGDVSQRTIVLGLTLWGMIVVPLTIRDLVLRHYQRNILFLLFSNFLLYGITYLIASSFAYQPHLWTGLLPGFGPLVMESTDNGPFQDDRHDLEVIAAMYGFAVNSAFTAILLIWHWRLINREAKALAVKPS